MKKTKVLLPLIVFPMACIWLLVMSTALLSHEEQGWLSVQYARAQGASPTPLPTPTPTSTPLPREKEATPVPPSWANPTEGRLSAFDPEVPDIRVDFPAGAVSRPIEVEVYRTDELPAEVPSAPGGIVGSAFFFGAWIRGQGRTINTFNESIVINVRYEDGDSSQVAANEERLRLTMYAPDTLSWVKMCSHVDPYINEVSAALLVPTPFEEGGNALFALAVDDMPSIDQAVDDQGNTTLTIPDSNFSVRVLAGTVAVGTYFEVTRLSNAPDSDLFKLLPTPIDIKACQADYTTERGILQIGNFPKPMTIELGYDADAISRAGGRANLTIVHQQNREWRDLEELGYRVVRGSRDVAVDVRKLGSYSAAVR
jgi:hypothetical protein